MAQTLVARIPCLTRTRSLVAMVPFMRPLWSNFCIYVLMLLLSIISIFCDRRTLEIEYENNSTNTLTAEILNRTRNARVQGPVVQSIVSLTSSLRGQLVKCFTTLLPSTLKFFVEKMREAFALQKLLIFFQQKYWHI